MVMSHLTTLTCLHAAGSQENYNVTRLCTQRRSCKSFYCKLNNRHTWWQLEHVTRLECHYDCAWPSSIYAIKLWWTKLEARPHSRCWKVHAVGLAYGQARAWVHYRRLLRSNEVPQSRWHNKHAFVSCCSVQEQRLEPYWI